MLGDQEGPEAHEGDLASTHQRITDCIRKRGERSLGLHFLESCFSCDVRDEIRLRHRIGHVVLP